MPEHSVNLRVTEQGEVSIVEFQDRKILEEMLIDQIEEELIQLAEAKPSARLLLNFRNVEHLSSAALGMLIKLHDKVRKNDGRLMLSDINPQIFQVFEITKLNRLFEIFPTSQQALAKA
jgi:anti-sigma B factor antagonist